MKIFPLRLMSQYDKASNLLHIIEKTHKKPYERPFINHGKNIDEIVHNSINETSKIITENGKCKYSVDKKRVSQAMYLRTIFKNLLNRGNK